ncbi:MAG TPA: HlyD family efflux transporter periplasmic adaptor subunit [Phycisphaerae bacterium]|nr:HlyD family efflux transporter periplasmic adaptor subunit [Phycisphaerae bacterium]
MKKFVILSILALALLGGGGYVWYAHAEAAAAESAKDAVATAKVERKTLRVSVQSQGAVASNQDVDIKCKASGNIITLPYTDVSAAVPPGALLLELDDKDQLPAYDTAVAVVHADEAKIEEAKLNWQISKMSLQTTQQRDEADLSSAKAKAADAHAKAQRTEQLFQDKLASKEDLETAQTLAAQADADVATAQAAIAELEQTKLLIDTKEKQIAEIEAQLVQDTAKKKTAEQNVGYCKVYAPLPAPGQENDPPQWYISKMTAGVSVGYLVQSGSSGTSGGTTIMTLGDMSHVFILATVAESDIGGLLTRFLAGQQLPVDITADAYPGVKFKGKVVRIAQTGVSTSNVVTFEVKIEVTSPNRNLLRPLMTADVEIVSAERPDAILIPVQAFSRKRADAATESATRQANASSAAAPSQESADTQPAAAGTEQPHGRRGGKRKNANADQQPTTFSDQPLEGSVTVLTASGAQEQRDVIVGVTDGASYEVLNGLNEGDTVVLNKMGADSKWRGNRGGGGGGGGGMMRGMGH